MPDLANFDEESLAKVAEIQSLALDRYIFGNFYYNQMYRMN
ncbi:hypothetical protein [Pseudanabaena sp. UWO310]|nr:hypothetical protein [Pseudanabaena sp. UWO310]